MSEHKKRGPKPKHGDMPVKRFHLQFSIEQAQMIEQEAIEKGGYQSFFDELLRDFFAQKNSSKKCLTN